VSGATDRPWDDDELAALDRLDHLSAAKAAAALTEAGWPRTRNAVNNMRRFRQERPDEPPLKATKGGGDAELVRRIALALREQQRRAA
jgi:hypothetical protein